MKKFTSEDNMDLKESFDTRKNECLRECEEYFKQQHNPFDDLKHKINNPTKAWFNKLASTEMWKLSEWLKSICYDIDNDLFSNPVYRPLYDWLNAFCRYPLSEVCSISPVCLKQVGFKEGDELWYWRTPDVTWKYMFGRAGYCIVRGGIIVWSMMTEMN